MSERKSIFLFVLITVLCAFSLSAGAQDKFAFNKAAWKGITFSEIFGNPVAPLPEAQPCPAGAADPGQGMTLDVLVDRLAANVNAMDAKGDPKTEALKESVSGSLTELKQYLDANSSADNRCLKTWYVRSFFEDDLKKKHSEKQVIKDLFEKHFEVIETKGGLTLPWLTVASMNTHMQFINLVSSGNFLERLGSHSYATLADMGMAPAVDDEMIYLARKAFEIGLFGSLSTYGENPKAVVTMDDLSKNVILAVNNYCCNRTTRKCVAMSGYNCTLAANGYCSMTAQMCP